MQRIKLAITALALALAATSAHADELKPNVLDPTYDHDRWGTSNGGILKDFRAYRSSFDNEDDDDGFGGSDAWGVPEWVAYEIKEFAGECVDTSPRPDWITDDELHEAGLMPDDDSYRTTGPFRTAHGAWFERGHLQAKVIAARQGADAEWNTHTFYNAVPQRGVAFNGGIWGDLEDLTGAWAQHFGAVWVVTGPIFVDRHAFAHLGDPGEFPVAIPEAIFKIVIKDSDTPNQPDVMAFIYPQVGPGYLFTPYDHRRYLTTVDEIERLTGIDFLMSLPDGQEATVEANQALGLWPADDDDFVQACRNNGG